MRTFFHSLKYSFRLLYKSSKLLFFAYFILQIACSITPLISTFFLKELIDGLVSSELVMLYVWLYIGSIGALLVFQSVQALCYNSMQKKAEHQYTCDLIEKMNTMPLSFLDTSEGKNMIDEVRHLTTVVPNLPNYMIQTIAYSISFIIAFSRLLAFHVIFSMLFIALTVPGTLSQLHFRKRADMLRKKQAPDVRRVSYYRWMLTDIWPAKDVRMYNLTHPLLQRYDEEKAEYLSANKKLDKRKMCSAVITEFLMRSGEIVFSFFVIHKALLGDISVGDVTLYIGFAVTAVQSFQNLVGTIIYGISHTTANMKYVFEFYSFETRQIKAAPRKLLSFNTLEFKNVFFKYPKSDQYVLKGLSFTLKKGDKLSIVGINGSGKSTIIKLMIGLYEIESGQILINGYPLSDYDINNVRKVFSVLFQSFAMYPLTLRENVALSELEKMHDDKVIENALAQSGIYEELNSSYGNGLDSYMTRKFDDKGIELSKGQWQKIALSRAYFKNAPIIIFDEPSAALDAEAEDRIFKSLESVSEGKTSILISHRISSARTSDKIIVLDNGRIVEQGSHHDLINHDGLYAKLYNLQREKYTAKETEQNE